MDTDRVGRCCESARYLAFALSPFPGTPPPFLGFLQSLQVWRLVHLRPGLFNVSRSMSHGCPRSASTQRRLSKSHNPPLFARPKDRAAQRWGAILKASNPPTHSVRVCICLPRRCLNNRIRGRDRERGGWASAGGKPQTNKKEGSRRRAPPLFIMLPVEVTADAMETWAAPFLTL